MCRILNDLQEIPQDWFDELERTNEPKDSELESIDFDLYQSECPELLGNMELELFFGKGRILLYAHEDMGAYWRLWKPLDRALVQMRRKVHKRYRTNLEKLRIEITWYNSLLNLLYNRIRGFRGIVER